MLTVFTEVTLTEHRTGDFSRFETKIRKLDEIVEGMLEGDYGIEKYFSYVVIKSPFIKQHYPIQRVFGGQH